MVKVLMLFVSLLAIFILGFTFQAAALYVPATGPEPQNPELGNGDGSGGIIIRNALTVFEMLYFAQFGLVDTENLPPLNRCPWWSIPLLKAVVGIYMMITFIMLVNLLIATMEETYEKIASVSDLEWKFGRAKLFRNMNKTSAAPTPINLITKLFVYVKILGKHRGLACQINTQQYVNIEENLDDSDTLQAPPNLPTIQFADDEASDGNDGKTSTSGRIMKAFSFARKKTPVKSAAAAPKPQAAVAKVQEIINWGSVSDKYIVLHRKIRKKRNRKKTTTRQEEHG